jgi:ABC-type transport system involved in multi-copper enzyme maturation permease subunit
MPDPTPSRKKPKPPPKAGVVGPLFNWELLRLARRGQDSLGRFLLAMALFVVLTVFSMIWFRGISAAELFFGSAQAMSIQESANFGEWFSMTFLYGQLTILCLLTPAYAAGGISEEKDRKTMVFLLVSELTDREIVFGKFFGRTVFLLGILFAGLPILAMTQLHGGVSPRFLLFAYLVTATTVILVSAISAAAACQAQTYRGGLFRAYFLMAVVVLAGCGVPFLNPFLVISYIKNAENPNDYAMHTWGFGYALAQLVISGAALWVAIRAIRNMRAKLVRSTPKPPPWVRERYRDEDKEKAYQERQERLRQERIAHEKAERKRLYTLMQQAVVLKPEEAPRETNADGQPVRLKARRVTQMAMLLPALPTAEVIDDVPILDEKPTKRDWGSEDKKKSKNKYRNPELHAAKGVSWKPKIEKNDPFFWKERYSTGQTQGEDDESIKGITRLLAGVSGVFVFLAVMFAILTFSTEGQSGFETLRTILLLLGSAGFFAHLLQVGLASCGTICRERQHLTLESLLTIPEDRKTMLWPKWVTSATKGIWFYPSSLVLILGFALSKSPAGVLPAIVYFLAAIPFATSFGLWLSTRCQTINKAILWFLPVAGMMTVVPLAIGSWMGPTTWFWWCLTFQIFAGVLVFGGWWFWWRSAKAFEAETILGAGRK